MKKYLQIFDFIHGKISTEIGKFLMSKRNKLYIILFAIVLLGCIWAFASAAFITKSFKADIINNIAEKQELKVRGIFVTETKDGEKYWEIYADEGQVDSETKVALLYNPVGNFYDKGEVIMSFKSDKGTYQEDTKKIILYDNTLMVYKDGTNVTANKFIWAGKDNEIIAKDNVVITKTDGSFLIKGQEASLSNNMTHFTIKNKSESRLYNTNGVAIK